MNAITPPPRTATPILIPCPNCTDGTATTNDPSSARRCPVCDGTATRELCCSSCGEFGATEFLGGLPFHQECAEEERVGALWVEEDVL